MSVTKQLSDFEKGKIVAYHECGISNNEIGKKLSRSHTTIGRFLKRYKETGSNSRKVGCGRKRKTTER
jgi:transposase